MSGLPESIRYVLQWTEKAENDLKNAEHTSTLEDNCLFDTFASTPVSAPRNTGKLFSSGGRVYPKETPSNGEFLPRQEWVDALVAEKSFVFESSDHLVTK